MNKLFLDRTKFIPVEEFSFPSSSKVSLLSKWKGWIIDTNGFNWLAILLMLCMGLIIYQRYRNKKNILQNNKMNTFLQDIFKATTSTLASLTTSSPPPSSSTQEHYQSQKTPIPIETKLLSNPAKLAQMRDNYLKIIKN